jgi:hypothetical protein
MKNTVKKLLAVICLSAFLAGCGGSTDDIFVNTQTAAPSDEELINQAMVDDPATAIGLLPIDHLDPLRPAPPGNQQTTSLPVSDLEANYETLFGSLSQDLGVTLQSPENVANIAFIKSQPDTGNFDLNAKPILNNSLGIPSVSFQPVNYSTTVPLPGGDQTFQVSGGLLIPDGIDKSQLKGVIVYFHGTTFSKAQVGSNVDNPETQLCAQVFASQGYVVLIPDYVGQGVDWQNVHPYVLYPTVSAQTAADMLTAVNPILRNRFNLNVLDPALKLFSAGYSEGGAYSLWFNSYLSSNPSELDSLYQLTHSVGMEGAYSTSQVTYDYLFDNVSKDDGNPFNVQSVTLVNIVKPVLSADAFLSYATYSLGSNFNSVFNPNFFQMTATAPVPQEACNVDGQQVTIAEAFARPDTDVSSQIVAAGLGKRANQNRYPGPLELLTSSENNIQPLVSSTILQPGPLADLQAVLESADVDLTPCTNGSVSIITLGQDSVVVPNNFDLLSARFPNKFRKTIKIDQTQLLSVSAFSNVLGRPYWIPIDHLQGPVFEFLYTLNIFNELS